MNCPCEGQQNYSNVTGVPVRDLPIDQFEAMPDYFMTIRVKENLDGTVKYQSMLTPGDSIMPTENSANILWLPANNSSLTVPENQVLPAYVENNSTQTVIMPADENHPAQFLVLEVKDNGMAKCQNCGWAKIPAGHKYTIGANYYRSNKLGEVTTDPSQTGQYLFTPVGRFNLALEIKRGI